MENKELREAVLGEAVRIGEWLISIAKRDDNGLYWETMSMDMDRNVTWQKSEGIYSGVSGIALFFLELFKQTGKEEYKQMAIEGMQWTLAHCRENESDYYALITGRMGVTYVLLQMAEVLGQKDEDWTKHALEIARSCKDFLSERHIIEDLINGRSGTLLGLIHLHAATGEEWLLEYIDTFAKHLIDAAFPGPKGLYWDRSPKNINGLCGFSHGAAGIGFVFLELGHYFQNPAFYRLSQQAFLYESCHFDPVVKNWRDLRKGIFNDEDAKEHREAFEAGNMEFFTTGGNMNAWCHGAAGIGLARLRAYELFKNEGFDGDSYESCEKDAKIAVETTVGTDVTSDLQLMSQIACHGAAGNAEVFVKAYEVFNDPDYLLHAEKVAARLLEFRAKVGKYRSGFRDVADSEDTSMFMGTSGIGYYMLRLLDPKKVSSVLSPVVHTVCENKEAISSTFVGSASEADLAKRLLNKYYKRTLTVADDLLGEKLDIFLEGGLLQRGKEPLKKVFTDFIERELPSLPENEKELLNDVFILEREKLIIDAAVIGHSYQNLGDQLLAEKGEALLEMEPAEFLKLKFEVAPGMVVSGTDWNWYMDNEDGWKDNINQEPDMYPVMLKPSAADVMERPLSPLTYTILAEFTEGAGVADVQHETISAFEDLNPEDTEMLKEKVIEQIRHLLKAGLLVRIDG